MFINFSNHPSERWDKRQKEEAEKWGEIMDIQFPEVDPAMDEQKLSELADRLTEQILSCQPSAVMCQGEFSLCFAVVTRLQKEGIVVLAACSKRCVMEEEDSHGNKVKKMIFNFERFRRYV